MGTIRQKFVIKATPSELYQAMTNPFTIELWSGFKAEMSTEEGKEFSLWEGDISGKNLEMVEDTKIVQEWYFEDTPGQSIVTITLAKTRGGTSVHLVHENVPEEAMENMQEGWKDYYFGAIKEFFEK
jgi:activator of HSP90 ATPase